MRADRLLSIIWLLRSHGQLSSAELARRLEVSRRTILRDVEALSASGVPVFCERGPHGGVRLLPGYRTDVTGLTNEESRALFAAVTTWGAESLGLGDALASGVRKLLAAVPEAHREQSAEVASRILIDPEGWLPRPERERVGTTFRTVQAAVLQQRRLRIEYRRREQRDPRVSVVDPHGLVSAGSSWYLCATLRGEIRFLRLTRIERAEALVEPCQSQPEEDLATLWHRHRARFRESFAEVPSMVWVRQTRWRDVQEWAIRARDVPAPAGPVPGRRPPGDDWMCVELGFVDDLHALTVLLRVGVDAVVITPAQLRRDLLQHLDRITDLYTEWDREPLGEASGPTDRD